MNIVLGKRIDRYVGGVLAWLLTPFAVGRRIDETRTSFDSNHEQKGRPVETIVLIKFWGLGNIILISPTVRALRRQHPAARIHFVSFSSNVGALQRIDEIDQILSLDLRGWWKFGWSLLSVWWKLWRMRADRWIDFEQFCYLSSVLTLLSRPCRSIGFATDGSRRGRFYHQPVPYREDAHMVHLFARLAEVQGADVVATSLLPIRFSPAEERRAMSLVGGGKPSPLVGMHAGSGDNFPGRRWSEDRFAELADALVERYGARVYFTGTEGEAALVDRVRSHMKHGALNLCGKTTLGTLAGLLRHSHLFVSNDTGPLHVAAAMGTPLVALYGPNTPRLYGPVSAKSLVFYRELPCSPCISNLNLKESKCRMPLCIQSIRVDEVLEALSARRFLAPGQTGRGSRSAPTVPGAELMR